VRAEVVFERQDAFDMTSGPYGYERVGFSIGGRVFWVGCAGSGLPGGTYEADKALAASVVERWNRHWEGQCAECRSVPALGHPTQYETSCGACIQKANDRKWGTGK
jgi:hypothetical protein